MKKVILLILFLCSAISMNAVKEDGTINGYFQINSSSIQRPFWPMGINTYTNIGIKQDSSVNIFITEKRGNIVKWTITSSAENFLGNTYSNNCGTFFHFTTNGGTGVAQLIAEDENGQALIIDIYVSAGGLDN